MSASVVSASTARSSPRRSTPSDAAERSEGRRHRRDPPVEQDVGNAGLALRALGELLVFRRDRPEIDDEIGFEPRQRLRRHLARAAGEGAELGQPGIGCGDEAAVPPVGFMRPTEHLVRRHRVEKRSRRRPRREDAVRRFGGFSTDRARKRSRHDEQKADPASRKAL